VFHYTFTAKSDGARILKIGQHLAKLLCAREVGCLFESRRVIIRFFGIEIKMKIRNVSDK